MLHSFENQKLIHGVKVYKRAPSITHMLFADDSYFYCKAGESEVVEILTKFELASGQKVNLSKSSVFYSTNIRTDARHQLCSTLQIEEARDDCMYLGLPNMMKRSKVETMGFLKDKVIRRAQGWDGKIINQGGKEVLVKSVIQSLPTYTMSVTGKEFWVAPQIEYMKISADAAIFSEYNASGLALIARDDHGDLVQARTRYLPGMVSSIMVEALTIKEALSWIKIKGRSKVVVESDCLIAIQVIRSKTPMVSLLGQVVQSCRNILVKSNTVSLFFVKRSANMAAHELARLSCSFSDRVFDRSSIHIQVQNVLRDDLEF
ncbi:hypothetical protein AgCh_035148 [Apium graveolens]